jgi:hypothetical protein
MKKILSIFAITVAFAACNNNPKAGAGTDNTTMTTDTATLNHNAFTDKAREVQLNGVSDTIVSNDGNTYVKVKPKEAEPATVKAPENNEKPIAHRSSTHTKRASSGSSGAGTSKSESSTVSNGKSGTSGTESKSGTASNGTSGTKGTDTATTTATTPKKEGWSKAAKGGVIGAGAGAAAGAIISKKKGKGAIIGGIIGASGGYIIGRGKDKKDGRY